MFTKMINIHWRALIAFLLMIPILCIGDYVPGEVLVRFKRGVVELPPGETKGGISVFHGSFVLQDYLLSLNLSEISKVFPDFEAKDTLASLEDGSAVHAIDLSLVFKFSFSINVDIPAVVDSLDNFPEIIYAEPNHIIRFNSAPNDPRFDEQWALEQGPPT